MLEISTIARLKPSRGVPLFCIAQNIKAELKPSFFITDADVYVRPEGRLSDFFVALPTFFRQSNHPDTVRNALCWEGGEGVGDEHRKSDIRFPLDLPATLRRRSETAPRGTTQSQMDIYKESKEEEDRESRTASTRNISRCAEEKSHHILQS